MPFPLPGYLPDPGMELTSPTLAGGFLTTELPGKLDDWVFAHKTVSDVDSQLTQVFH